jgi:hypothetical protein
MLEENNMRRGFFEPDQFAAVLVQLPDDLKPIMETAYTTGWRIASKLLTRQKHHVELQAGWLRLGRGESKNRGRPNVSANARIARSS